VPSPVTRFPFPWFLARFSRHAGICVLIATVLAACGGGYPSSPGGSGGGGGGGGGAAGPIGATVTIANGRVSPAAVTVTVGQSVNFVNQDGRTRNISSDPHPDHTQCPAVTVGNLANGQSRATAALTVARTCGYHDHDDPDNPNVKGTITVVAGS
jgi:plastocyanin